MKESLPLFFNRELSWLEFNARVLEEAYSKDVPLLERFKFMSIATSNFDEFFMIRVAGLKRLMLKQPNYTDESGLSPKQQLIKISERVHELTKKQCQVLNEELMPSLLKAGISYVSYKEFTKEQQRFAESLFEEEIFPILTPLRTDNDDDFPYITNLRLHAAFILKPLISDSTLPTGIQTINNTEPLAIVQVPRSISRIIWLPSNSGTKIFTLVDDIISFLGTKLFPGYSVKESIIFKTTCDADFSVNEETNTNFIDAMEEVLSKRQRARPVRIVCNYNCPEIISTLTKNLGLTEDDIYITNGLIDLTTLGELTEVDGFSELKYPLWKTFYPFELEKDTPMWDTLKRKDILLHVPYESFDPIIDFINTASDDPNVLAIKMTLYRTSGNSPIVQALERAARNGKQVTVFVELKARFDEKQNISWASQLERAGVIVVHGIVNLKVHAKLLLVVRKEQTGIKRYIHLSTGNYNDKTAHQYSDLSLFTTNTEIANDSTIFFNMISGYSAIQPMKELYMAPINLKSKLIGLIEREIRSSSPDCPGLIIAKMNSLVHQDIIKALYKASCSNVHILLNVRGICTLVPGVPNQSENISVVSIVDRFLEHSRIFFFQNSGSEEIYLSSADWMPRNLDRRVELMFPIVQDNVFKRIKDQLSIYFSDNTKSHYLQSDGTWIRRKPMRGEEKIRSQEYFYNEYKRSADMHNKTTPKEFVVRRSEPK